MKKKLLYISFILFVTKVYSSGINLVEPINNYNSPAYSVTFNWNPITSQSAYIIKVALDPDFNTIINTFTVTQTSKQITFSPTASTVYWKVTTNKSNGFVESEVYKLNFINPSKDPNLLVWLAADSNVVLNPDSTISSWNNIIPNGLNAIQPDPDRQPKLASKIRLLNNKNVIRLDGLNDNFTIGSGGVVGSCYTIFNFNAAVFPDYSALLTTKLFYGALGFDNYFITASLPNSTLYEPSGYLGGNGNKGNVFLNNIPISSPSLAPLSTYKLFAGIRNIAQPKDMPDFSIGAETNASRFWKGDISEMIISKTNSLTEADSIQTYLFNKYAPPVTIKDTVVGNNLCASVSISAPNNYVSYLWSTGATTQTINATPGRYSIKTSDVFLKESTTSFNVYPYVRLNNITVTICQGDTFKIDLKTPVGFAALWNTGNATTKINITQTGQYRVTITDASGTCSVNDTINVVVDKPILLPTPASGALLICRNEKLFLNTATAFDSIRWSTGSTATFITVTTPGAYSVYGRTIAGCIINQSFGVTIAGNAPTASFTNTSACEKSKMLFTDGSTTNGGTITNWKWTFGNGNTSTIQNPIDSFTSTGNYSVGFKITTNEGCSDSISKTITVNKRPNVSFENRRSCEGNPTIFEDKSTSNADSIINWKWNFENLGLINNIKNPAFVFPSANTYNVKLSVTNSNGCIDSVINAVKVNQSPISNFSFDAVCGKSPVNFRFLASVLPAPNPPQPTIATWQWDFGDNTFNSSIKDVSHIYDATGNYNVKLTVTSSDQCPNTIEKQVKVYEFPIVDFAVSATQCAGKEIQFTDISQTPDGTPMASWKWFFSGQSTDTMQNTSYAFASQGNYTIQLTAANAVGCSGTKLRNVAVSALPVPKFTFSPQNGLPPLIVNYTNQSPNNGSYIWDYGDNSSLVSGYNPPTHTYTTKGTYPIKLIATNFLGCTDTLTKFILVDKAFIDGVMTSITIIPNGDYYQIQVTILNGSNIEIRELGLNLQLGGGAVIQENWTGSLLPGQSTVYDFFGQIKISDNVIPVICTTIDNVNNNTPEDVTTNNSTCKEVRVGNFGVLNVYPNPALESINFGVMLPKDGKVTVGFIDILGQVMFKKEFDGTRGYNKLTINTSLLNATAYVAVITFDGEIIREKFFKRNIK